MLAWHPSRNAEGRGSWAQTAANLMTDDLFDAQRTVDAALPPTR